MAGGKGWVLTLAEKCDTMGLWASGLESTGYGDRRLTKSSEILRNPPTWHDA